MSLRHTNSTCVESAAVVLVSVEGLLLLRRFLLLLLLLLDGSTVCWQP